MVESAFYFSIMSVLVKLAGQTVPFQEIVLARTIIALVLSWILIKRAGITLLGNRRGLLALRGLFGLGGLICFYYSVSHLPLADATVIQYTNPVIVALLAALLLGERIGKVALGAAFFCMLGVGLIAKPDFFLDTEASALPTTDVLIAVGGAIFSAFAYTTVRKLGETEEPLVVVFWFPLVAFPVVLPWALSTGYVPNLTEVLILLGVGVSTQIAQVRLTQGLQMESAGRAMSITYLQVVFAMLWGMLIFGEIPPMATLIGAAIIIISVVFVARSRAT